MVSNTEPNAGLVELARCLHGVAKVLRILSADHTEYLEKAENFPAVEAHRVSYHYFRQDARR